MHKFFLYLSLCTLSGFLASCPLFTPTGDLMDFFLRGFLTAAIVFSPQGLISPWCTQILNFLRTNRDDIVHALPGAFLSAAICAVTLPVVASTTVVIVLSILSFVSVIGIHLYRQGVRTSIKGFVGDLDPNTGKVSALTAGDLYHQSNGNAFQATTSGTGNWVLLNQTPYRPDHND